MSQWGPWLFKVMIMKRGEAWASRREKRHKAIGLLCWGMNISSRPLLKMRRQGGTPSSSQELEPVKKSRLWPCEEGRFCSRYGKFCKESVAKLGIVQGAREGKLGSPEQRESRAYPENRKACCVSGVKAQNLCRGNGNTVEEQPLMKRSWRKIRLRW